MYMYSSKLSRALIVGRKKKISASVAVRLWNTLIPYLYAGLIVYSRFKISLVFIKTEVRANICKFSPPNKSLSFPVICPIIYFVFSTKILKGHDFPLTRPVHCKVLQSQPKAFNHGIRIRQTLVKTCYELTWLHLVSPQHFGHWDDAYCSP